MVVRVSSEQEIEGRNRGAVRGNRMIGMVSASIWNDNTEARAETIFMSDILSAPATSTAFNNYYNTREGYWFLCLGTVAELFNEK
jgi:hypothetical protein